MFGHKRVGIIGSGQLGRMTIQEARRLNIYTIVLTDVHPSPASEIADDYIIGSLYDSKKIEELASRCDVITYEIEHIDVNTLKKLENEGKEVVPSARVLEIIQDKSKQKDLLKKHGIPTSDWDMINENNVEELIIKYGFPVVQKSCRGGYDGKGVFVLKNREDINNMLKSESFFEKYVPFEKEIAVMVARNEDGEVKSYPLVEMEFDDKTNICDTVIVPAREDESIAKKAAEIAIQCIKALNGNGIFGVEMFLTKEKEIIVNEIAPRPHNSGHYTIEGCMTSQYEQFLRAILNMPLGSTKLLFPSAMVNVLGEKGYTGNVFVEGLEDVMKIEGAYVHLYGKRETKPNRKMGHITVIADNSEEALRRANIAKNILKIISK